MRVSIPSIHLRVDKAPPVHPNDSRVYNPKRGRKECAPHPKPKSVCFLSRRTPVKKGCHVTQHLSPTSPSTFPPGKRKGRGGRGRGDKCYGYFGPRVPVRIERPVGHDI
ncbi:hypothetical protein CEXT_681391 [Caerostris extrusa]|uniref:Uncharacterized protein n=1 Tax=Caerostris extrusa TaxID=172846 RepID=A0AAV4RG66_CAEEX|nr:hypothetical protein CEXT_681391 [Caerostris extrusa]